MWHESLSFIEVYPEIILSQLQRNKNTKDATKLHENYLQDFSMQRLIVSVKT